MSVVEFRVYFIRLENSGFKMIMKSLFSNVATIPSSFNRMVSSVMPPSSCTIDSVVQNLRSSVEGSRTMNVSAMWKVAPVAMLTGCEGTGSLCFTLPILGAVAFLGYDQVLSYQIYNQYKEPVLKALDERPKTVRELVKELGIKPRIYGNGLLRAMQHDGVLRSEERYEEIEKRGGRPRIYYRKTGTTNESKQSFFEFQYNRLGLSLG